MLPALVFWIYFLSLEDSLSYAVAFNLLRSFDPVVVSVSTDFFFKLKGTYYFIV